MKDCTKCKHADWFRTNSGRLHPSGDGRCKKEVKIPKLPASMKWGYGSYASDPSPMGGQINRREYLKEHCVYYEVESC